MTADEQKLRHQFCCGDMEAYHLLFDTYGTRLYRFCLRLSANAADAEDLVQEVFVAAFQGRKNFQGRASLATWLYRIALYRWRARQSDPDYHPLPLPGDEETKAVAINPMVTEIERLTLEWALAQLPVTLRETFLLVKGEGLTCAEAGYVLDVPTGTVKYRIHTATARLRLLLAAEIRPPRYVQLAEHIMGETIHEL